MPQPVVSQGPACTRLRDRITADMVLLHTVGDTYSGRVDARRRGPARRCNNAIDRLLTDAKWSPYESRDARRRTFCSQARRRVRPSLPLKFALGAVATSTRQVAEPHGKRAAAEMSVRRPNVPWCKLQRGPACGRRCGAPAAVIRGANSAAKSMSAGVPPANYRSTEAARPPAAANGPLSASHQS